VNNLLINKLSWLQRLEKIERRLKHQMVARDEASEKDGK
jgi:hypothetical protein